MKFRPLHSRIFVPVLFLGLSAFSFRATAAPVSILIQPQTEATSKDTKIYDNSPTGNFSSTLDLYAPSSGATFSSLIQFDDTRLRGFTRAQILSANLALYSYSTSAINGTATVSPLTAPWAETPDESTATGYPLATYSAVFGPSPTITFGASVSSQVINSTGYHSFDVRSIVQDWAGGTSNYGFFLQATSGIVPVADTDSPFVGVGPILSVIVDDVIPPTVTTTPTARTLVVGASGQVSVPDLRGEVVATDNTGISSITQSPAAGTLVSPGTTVVTLTVHDLANLGTQVTTNLTVVDTTAPTFTQPGTLALTADPATGLAVVPDVTASLGAADNVGITSTVQTPTASSTLSLGASTIQVTLADAAGNSTVVQVPVEVSYARPTGGAASTLGGLTGDIAPSAGVLGGVPAGAKITSFGIPALSADRELVASAQVSSGATLLPAIYSSTAAGSDSLLAFKGSPAGLGGNITFLSFLDPVISPSGAVAFGATVKGTGVTVVNDQGIWSDAFGNGLHAVLREGQQVPGLPVGARLKAVSSYSLRDTSLLALVTLLPGGGVTVANDTVLLRQTGDSTATVVARKGFALTTGGSPVATISALSPALLSPGQGRSQGDEAAVAKVTLQNGTSALVKLAGSTVSTVLASGTPSLAGPYGSLWQSFGVPATDAEGKYLAFSANLRLGQGTVTAANDAVLAFSEDDTTYSFIAREGSAAHSVNSATYVTLYDPLVNTNGDIAFLATIKGTGVTAANQLGLWWGHPATYTLLARQGTPAPGKDGLPLTAKWASFTSTALPDGKLAGPIILGTISGTGITMANNQGVWAVDSQGTLRLLLRSSDVVNIGTVATPVNKTVKTIALLNAANGIFGVSRSFNETGSLAAKVTFTDNSSSIIRVDIP